MELPNDINELKQLVYTLIDEIVSLKTEVATLKSQVASLEKENAALRKENARKASQISQTTKGLNIAFTGSLYKWHPIKLFLEEIENIMQQNEDFAIHINFYGINEENFLRSLLTTLPKLQTVCNIYPKTPNVILLENLAKNNVLLLFNDYSILGTKIFDYLAVRRHIILCFSEDEEALNLKKQYFPINDNHNLDKNLQEQMILEKNGGTVIKNRKDLHIVLNNLLDEYNRTCNIACNSSHIEDVSRKYQTKLLVKFLLDTLKR